ncbi:MAG: lipid A deacylase LpxR family protein [Gallionella sp.]
MKQVQTIFRSAVVAAALLLGASGAQAGDESPPPECKEKENGQHVLWENDVLTSKLLGKSDKWYTDGIKWASSYKPNCTPGWLPDKLQNTLADLMQEDRYDIVYGVTVGQLMFTPKNLATALPQPMDRFWGGWLYTGMQVQRQPRDDSNELETLEVDYGVTGALSGAEQVQRVIHRLSNSTPPQGWNNQIKTEPSIQITYSRTFHTPQRRIPGTALSSDFAWHYGAVAGTLFDYVNGGVTARLGTRLTDVTPGTIENPAIGQFSKLSNAAYLMTRLDMKAVAHNTFIDGSLLREAPHDSQVTSKQIVPQLSLGVVLEWAGKGNDEGKRLSILLHRRGSEFRSPAGPAPIFNFGTIAWEWDM